MMRFKDTNEYRIQKQGTKGYKPSYLAERKVLVWYGWNPFSKKPSGYHWSTVVNNRGKGIGGYSLEEVKQELDQYIADQNNYSDCDETVYEVRK